MDLRISRPSIPAVEFMSNCKPSGQRWGDIQKANGDEQGPDDQDRNPELRFPNPIVFRSIVSVDLIRELYSQHGSHDEPYAESEVSKTGSPNTEPVSTSEEVW